MINPRVVAGLIALSLAFCVSVEGGVRAEAVRHYDPSEKTIVELERDLGSGKISAVELLRSYQARIAIFDPKLHAVIALNPDALLEAQAIDRERLKGKRLGPLAGLPLLIKDNIETADPIPTTAGSLALAGNISGRDAPVVARLRAAGAVILGKTNLSEWANYRSIHPVSGWSAVRGQTANPYGEGVTPCGSSSGSAVAVTSNFAAGAVGTETDGSITCPGSVLGIVGLKPTVGLLPRTHIVPVSHTFDTPGPMGRTVRDVALLLGVMAGPEAGDPASQNPNNVPQDYAGELSRESLRGVRVGVMRFAAHFEPRTTERFEEALSVLREQGAVLVEIEKFPGDLAEMRQVQRVVLADEFRDDIDAYLKTTNPVRVPSRSLASVVAFDTAHAKEEMALFGQQLFEFAETAPGEQSPGYLVAVHRAAEVARFSGIDAMLAQNNVKVLVAPTMGPATPFGQRLASGGAGGAASVGGCPHLTIPMGLVNGFPVGLSLIGAEWSEAKLLSYGYAYEQASLARRPPQLGQ